MSLLISVHMPKTAGASFLNELKNYFHEELKPDYDYGKLELLHTDNYVGAIQDSLHNFNEDFTKIKCIHGHFFPVKYLLLSKKVDIKFVTWLREPVNRLLSHYYFWQRIYDPKTSTGLHKRVVEEKWSLRQFCLAPQFQNTYTSILWGVPLEYFDFIGITELYEEDRVHFSNRFNVTLSKEPVVVNTNPNPQYEIEGSLRKEIEIYHEKDMELYKRALEYRKLRINSL